MSREPRGRKPDNVGFIIVRMQKADPVIFYKTPQGEDWPEIKTAPALKKYCGNTFSFGFIDHLGMR